MSLRIPYFRKGAKTQQKKSDSAPLRDIKTQKISDLTGGGNSDYTAHDSIIPVFTV